MHTRQIAQLEPMLNEYLRQFDDCFGRIEPAKRLKAYVTGQLSDLQRKSIEPMADAAGLPPRNLQQFLSLHKWDERHMLDRLAGRLQRSRGDVVRLLIREAMRELTCVKEVTTDE